MQIVETKIQPSLERENANDWLDFEIEDTTSNSETRLFNLVSPATAALKPHMDMTQKAMNCGRIKGQNMDADLP